MEVTITSNHLPQRRTSREALRDLGNGKPSFLNTSWGQYCTCLQILCRPRIHKLYAVMMSKKSKIFLEKILLRLVVERTQSFLVSCDKKLWRMHAKYFHHFNVLWSCVRVCYLLDLNLTIWSTLEGFMIMICSQLPSGVQAYMILAHNLVNYYPFIVI